MDIMSSYNCNADDVKMEKPHQELQGAAAAMAMESSDAVVAGASRLEYWTAPKSTRMELCSSIIYGDALVDHMMLPKAAGGNNSLIHGWRDLTGASRTSSGTKPFGASALNGRLQGHAIATIGEKEYIHGRILKVGSDGEEADGIAGRQGYEINVTICDCIFSPPPISPISFNSRWEEAATSEGDHAQYKVQKEELRINPSQVDRSIDHRLQSGRDLEDFDVLGMDIRRRSRQDIIELEVDINERGKESRDHVTYGECQKNQSADRGITSVDGCGEFLSSGKDGKLAFTCAACGCHRNFHQRIVLFEGEEQELMKAAKTEKDEGGGNYYTTTCGIDRVAHELIAAANGAIALAQESLCYSEGRAREFFIEEQNIIAKISLENLDHIAKVINSTTECLTILRKPFMFRKDCKSDCPHEGPSSSDASPVITVEKRAIQSLLTPPSPARPFGVIGSQPLKNSITMFSDASGMHNCGSAPRKPLERPSQKLKRTRTRISLEQREKLNAFAEKAGWTVVGQRKETIDAACQYIGIEPKTLKYWIHNSKQKWKRQPSQSDDTSK